MATATSKTNNTIDMLLTPIDRVNEGYTLFQQFFRSEYLLLLAAAICLGLATKELIEKLMTKIILPVLQWLTYTSIVVIFYRYLQKRVPKKFQLISAMLSTVGNVSWDIFVWLAIIVLIFIIFEFIIKRNLTNNNELIAVRKYYENLSKKENKTSYT